MPDPQEAYKLQPPKGLRLAPPDDTSAARAAPDEDADPQLNELTELVGKAQKRDPAAFTRLIRRNERMALSVAFSALGGRAGDGERAGDVVQEAFVRAWERLADLKDPARFGPWLCGVVRNLAIDAQRRARVRPVADPELADPLHRVAPDPLDELDLREQRRLVGEALAELDETSRPVVVMRYYEGLSSKEIAHALGIAPAAVDMRLTRARQQLRKKLEARARETFTQEV